MSTDGHIHAFAAAAEVPGIRRLCGLCGHIAARPQACTEPECDVAACLACITPEPAALPMEAA